ncbi:hypothetical protein QVD17_31766 [Tagetes erecta]|uniref:Transmembrane protein n=1 Tax=Tagetes erecta TaxID=13708 RepID=A0AAD8K4V2_TARER|nr:hypothetical protein QVD17_31766 [Tagetes erecta]
MPSTTTLTTKILNSNSLHFTTISLLFLLLTTSTITTSLLSLPLTVSASTAFQSYISFTNATTQHDPFILFLIKTIITSSQTLLTFKMLITTLPFTYFIILPAIASITLIVSSSSSSSTVESRSHSHVHLLYTLIIRSTKLIILSLALTISSITITEAIKALSLQLGLLLTTNGLLILQYGTMCLKSSLMIVQYVVDNIVLYLDFIVASGEEVTKTNVEGEVYDEYVRLSMNDEDEDEDQVEDEEVNGGQVM